MTSDTRVKEKLPSKIEKYFENKKGFIPVTTENFEIILTMSRTAILLQIYIVKILYGQSKDYDLFTVPELAINIKCSESAVRAALIEGNENGAFLVYDLGNKGKVILINKPTNRLFLQNIIDGHISFECGNYLKVTGSPPKSYRAAPQTLQGTVTETTGCNQPESIHKCCIEPPPIDLPSLDPLFIDHHHIDQLTSENNLVTEIKNDDDFKNKNFGEKKEVLENCNPQDFHKISDLLEPKNLESIEMTEECNPQEKGLNCTKGKIIPGVPVVLEKYQLDGEPVDQGEKTEAGPEPEPGNGPKPEKAGPQISISSLAELCFTVRYNNSEIKLDQAGVYSAINFLLNEKGFTRQRVKEKIEKEIKLFSFREFKEKDLVRLPGIFINYLKEDRPEPGNFSEVKNTAEKQAITEKFKPVIETWFPHYFKATKFITENEAKLILSQKIKKEFTRYKEALIDGSKGFIEYFTGMIKKTINLVDLKDCFLCPDPVFIDELFNILEVA